MKKPMTLQDVSWACAADRTLHKLTGLRLSESTVERTTESAGTFLKEQQEKGILVGDGERYAYASRQRRSRAGRDGRGERKCSG